MLQKLELHGALPQRMGFLGQEHFVAGSDDVGDGRILDPGFDRLFRLQSSVVQVNLSMSSVEEQNTQHLVVCMVSESSSVAGKMKSPLEPEKRKSNYISSLEQPSTSLQFVSQQMATEDGEDEQVV